MKQIVTSDFKLGIIAGGQLGKLLVLAASNWDVNTYVMDQDPDCPASDSCQHFVQGDRFSYDDVYAFGQQVDMLTFEVEHINIDALKKLKAEGKQILPDPAHLEMIQDKGLQKQFATAHQIPTASFRLVEGKAEMEELLKSGKLDYPFVQKIRKGGYDGRGVAVIRNPEDLELALDGPSVIEDLVDIDTEISVIAARNPDGQVRCFPIVDMEFNQEANLVDMLTCPTACSEEVSHKALALAEKIVTDLEFSGLLAIELFLDKQGEVWLNEVAPRPHNSGHHTIESVVTSQYEQHLRAIFNYSLGSTALKIPAVMVNLLGEPGFTGPVRYEGFEACMAIDGVKVHLYGKKHTRPFRKMGHITILAETLEEAIDKARQVKEIIKVKSW